MNSFDPVRYLFENSAETKRIDYQPLFGIEQ